MKEAAGEANLTVVAIILIAVVVAVATPLVNSLMQTSAMRACCTDAGGVWEGNTCKSGGSGYSQKACMDCADASKVKNHKCAADYQGKDPMGDKYHKPA